MKKYPLLKHRRTRLHHLGEEQKKMGLFTKLHFSVFNNSLDLLSFEAKSPVTCPLQETNIRYFFKEP